MTILTKRLSVTALTILMLVTLLTGLSACSGGSADSKYAKDIVRIDENIQTSNGVSVTNYSVVIKDAVDWASAKDEEREGIAKAGVNSALEKIEKDGVTEYNITGSSEKGEGPFFLYNVKEKKIALYVGTEVAGEVALDGKK